MNIRTDLSGRRLAAFVRKDLFEGYRSILVIAAAVFGVLLVIYGISMAGGPKIVDGDRTIHSVLFGILLFIGGYVASSRAFREAHDRTRNHDWLMLPSSTLEKLTARLVLTSVGYAAGVVIFYSVFSVVAAGLSSLIFGGHRGLFAPWTREVGLMLANYLVMQSVFLVGAAFFRKNHFVKTVLSLTVIGFVALILLAVTVRLVFADYFTGMEPSRDLAAFFEGFEDNAGWELNLGRTGRSIATTLKVLYWSALAPICWVIAYFRLRETEVKDGV